MGTITRSFANQITSTGVNAIADGTIVNADINATSAITLNKLSGNPSFRNIVINGDMQIAQRSTSVASITTSGYYTLDRWQTVISSLGTWTQSQSTDVPSGYGFSKSLKMDCTTADASPSASDELYVRTKFEGQNLQYLKKGTANAVSLTASFWVKSTKTGTFIVELFDNDNSDFVSKSYTINASNTWEFKTVTFPADTTSAFDNDNAVSLGIHFYLGAGTDITSGILNSTWTDSAIQTGRAVGQVNCADSTSNDWLITGVQLEAGTSATDFEFLPIDVSLGRCLRYFELAGFGATAIANSTTNYQSLVQYKVTKRALPTASLTVTSNIRYRQYGVADRDAATASIGSANYSKEGANLRIDGFSSLTAGQVAAVNYTTTDDTGSLFAFSSEL